jgi:hypothetical protein
VASGMLLLLLPRLRLLVGVYAYDILGVLLEI